MSGADELADDTLRAIAEGSFPASDAESMALAAEVLRLRDRADAAHLAFVRIIQAASVCGEVDLAAVDATPVRALDVVEALVASWEHQLRAASQVPGLRARVEKAEAALNEALAAVREYIAADDAWGATADLGEDPMEPERVKRGRERLRTLAAGKADTRASIIAAIQAERARQDARWGEQNHPDVDRTLTDRGPSRYQSRTSAGGCTPPRMAEEYGIPTPSRARANCQGAASNGQVTWAHILVEEVAELVEAATLAQQGRGPDADVDSELVQVAAVCVSWLEARARRRGLAGEG